MAAFEWGPLSLVRASNILGLGRGLHQAYWYHRKSIAEISIPTNTTKVGGYVLRTCTGS